MKGKRQHRSNAGVPNCNLRTTALPLVAKLLLRGEDFDGVILSLTWAFGPPMEMKIGSARGCIMNPAWNGEGRLRSGYVETVSELDPECAF
jgi:hypothetical protein